MPSTERNSRVTVTVDGVNLGVWDERTGGAASGTTTQYNLGGMGARIALGGHSETTDVTVRKLKDADIRSRLKWLMQRQNRGQVVVIDQELDDEGAALDEPLVWRGLLKHIDPGNSSSNSDSAKIVEIQVGVNGTVA